MSEQDSTSFGFEICTGRFWKGQEDYDKKKAEYEIEQKEHPERYGSYATYGERHPCMKQFLAIVSGPWYDDSNHEFYGDTEKEVKDKAIEWLREVKADLSKLIQYLVNE
jgi:hypothetical protein